MTKPIIKWRVKQTPQMSADLFAQYMTAGDDRREDIAQAAKYQPQIPAGYHATARLAVRKFLVSKTRDWTIILDEVARLTDRANDPALHPKMRERFLTNVAALLSFQRGFNALGIGGLKLEELDPSQPKLKAGGLPISVSLDFLVHYTAPKSEKRIGGLLFAFPKRSEPVKTHAVARYERLARHASAMIHMHLTDHFSELGKPSPKHCLWIDNHLRRAHPASADYKTLVADMKVAGDRIAKEWNAVPPPKGFDPKYAKFVK